MVVLGAFHGRTYGALSATPQEAKQAPFAPLVPGFRAVPPVAEAVRGAVHGGTAAVLLEPIQGEGGVHVLDEQLLRAAREACDEHGAALIFDEIQTGMGRTGTLWAYEQTPVTPDAITSAKALGGGLPVGALVTGERLADAFVPGDHGSTFAGGPVVARAAIEALEITAEPGLLAGVVQRGAMLAAGLEALPHVLEVRGRGLMLACELDVDAPALVREALMEQRLVLNATGPSTLRMLPALTIDSGQVEDALERLGALLGAGERRRAARAGGGFELDDDLGRVDVDAVHEFIANESYWGRGRSREATAAAIAGARRVLGLYHDGALVGFARAVSDGATVAYLADVYVLSPHRGRGLGLELVREMIDGSAGAFGVRCAGCSTPPTPRACMSRSGSRTTSPHTG